MKNNSILFFLIIFLLFTLSCNNRPSEFYSKKERDRIRKYKPNILFTNYHLLDSEKFIELKSSVGVDSKPSFKIVCSFLDGTTLKFDGKKYEIDHYSQTILLPDFNYQEEKIDLLFELNEQQFSFPKSKIMTHSISDTIISIGIGTKLNWEIGEADDDILIAIRPNQEDCGREGLNGQKYGTIPKLIADNGEYYFNLDDFLSVGLENKNEVSVLLKRGKYKITKFYNHSKAENICISNISHSTFRAKMK